MKIYNIKTADDIVSYGYSVGKEFEYSKPIFKYIKENTDLSEFDIALAYTLGVNYKQEEQYKLTLEHRLDRLKDTDRSTTDRDITNILTQLEDSNDILKQINQKYNITKESIEHDDVFKELLRNPDKIDKLKELPEEIPEYEAIDNVDAYINAIPYMKELSDSLYSCNDDEEIEILAIMGIVNSTIREFSRLDSHFEDALATLTEAQKETSL